MDLKTINELRAVAAAVIQDYVATLEQQRVDALSKEMYSWASDLKASAREVEFVGYKLENAFSSIFVDALETMSTAMGEQIEGMANKIESTTHVQPVELPEIQTKHRTINTTTN